MIVVHCAKCGTELEQRGALLIGPPDADDKCKKEHLCTKCYGIVKLKVGGVPVAPKR